MLPFPWRQGEHMTVIGDTGTGKTTLIARILTERKYVLSVRTKSDKTPLPGKHVRTAAAFKRLDIGRDGRVLLDPTYERQAYEIYHAFETVWREDGWTVNIDELYYLTSQLGAASRVIERQINRFLTQGRSKGISVVSGMQRPVSTTRFAMSQSSHLIAFRVEGRDRKTLQDAGGDDWAAAVLGLGRYEFAWYYRPERALWLGTLDPRSGELLSIS